jgi:hypothetical protein
VGSNCCFIIVRIRIYGVFRLTPVLGSLILFCHLKFLKCEFYLDFKNLTLDVEDNYHISRHVTVWDCANSMFYSLKEKY